MGNGKSIRVWHDSWLDSYGFDRVISPRGSWNPDTTLDVFIDPVCKDWKKELVCETFLPFEAKNGVSLLIFVEWRMSCVGVLVEMVFFG